MDENLSSLFARLDERTRHMEEHLATLVHRMERDYVIQADFLPVKRLVYGLVAIILTGAAGAVGRLIIV